MKQKNALTPIPLAPAIPAILEALGLGALAYGASEASDSESNSFTIPDMPPTEWDLTVKPWLHFGANILAHEAKEAGDFLGSIPDAYGRQMRRFLTISSPRPVPVEEVKPTYMHAGWNRVNGGYRYYDPTLGRTTETYIDPVVIEGTYTSPYNQTTSLRAEPIVKMTPLVNTYQSSTPITLSTGQTVSLPSDITDYRVFDETADPSGDNGTSGEGSDNSGTVAVEGTYTPAVPAAGSTPVAPTPEQPEGEEPKKKRYRDIRRERLNRPEPEGNWDEILRGFDRQGMPSQMNNPSFSQQWTRWPRAFYGLGRIFRFLTSPGGLITTGAGGAGLYYLNTLKDENASKSTATSEEGVETRALEGDSNTGTSNNGNVGTGWTVIPTYTEPGYNPTNSGGQNQGTTERQVINLSEMDSVDSLFNPRR